MSGNNLIIPDFDSQTDDNLKLSLQKITEVPNTILITLHGNINTYNSNFFQNQISKIVDSGFINLIFLCEDLSYISSTGIGSFTTFLKLLRTKGGGIVLLKIQPKVYEVFQLLGFAQFFFIENSLEQAISNFKKHTQEEQSVFPKIFACPTCSKHLKAVKPGRFRCSECKSIISINEKGFVSLG